MKIKRYFPFIVLGVISIAAVIFALIFLWSLDVDSPTIAEKAMSTLRLGIPSGLALIVLVWLGAGLDYGLSFIPKKNLRILASLLVYLFLPAICCIILPSLVIMAVSGVFTSGWNRDSGFGTGLLMTIAFIPAVTGFVFIYIGAGTSSISRWLAGRIWPEPQESEPEEIV